MNPRRFCMIAGGMAALLLVLSPSVQGGVIIHEVDYDQPGTDTAEWVELFNPDATPQPLTGLDLVLYNGTLTGTCAEYCRINLDAYTIPAGSLIVFGQHACAVAPLCATTDAIQNGAPDAIAVEERGSGLVWDSVEYESDLVSSVCNFNLTNAIDASSSDGSIQWCAGIWIFSNITTPCTGNDCPVPTQPVTWGVIKALYE